MCRQPVTNSPNWHVPKIGAANELLHEDEHGAANKHISRISRCKHVRTRFRLIGTQPKYTVNTKKVLQRNFVLLIYNVMYTTF